jgi:putative FmdB family regulatory protein
MPIYEYRCSACGYQNDYLQRLSEPPLTDCPECGKSTFSKQVTAAGFQLKGTGWYATDFKHNGTSKSSTKKDGEAKNGEAKGGEAKSGEAGSKSGEGGSTSSSGSSSGADSGASSTGAAASGAGASPACT